MQEECVALVTTHTWTLVPSSPSQKLMGNKWLFKIKRKPDSSVQCHIARFVAKEYSQTSGIIFLKYLAGN